MYNKRTRAYFVTTMVLGDRDALRGMRELGRQSLAAGWRDL